MHAETCARERGLKPRTWRYLYTADCMRGCIGVKIIFYETWRQHPQWREIKAMAQARKCIDITGERK